MKVQECGRKETEAGAITQVSPERAFFVIFKDQDAVCLVCHTVLDLPAHFPLEKAALLNIGSGQRLDRVKCDEVALRVKDDPRTVDLTARSSGSGSVPQRRASS